MWRKTLELGKALVLRYHYPLLWVLCVVTIFGHMSPLLTNRPISGWDTSSHLYLTYKALELLKEGKLSGYDPNWFGGYAVFTLYPPLAYVVLLLPHLISLGVINVTLSFNAMLTILPLFLLAALCFTSAELFGKQYRSATLILGLFFLLLPSRYAHQALGMGALVGVGFVTNYVALPVFITLMGLFHRLLRAPSPQLYVVAILGMAFLLMSHLLTSIFCFWYLGCLVLVYRKRALRLALLVCAPAFLITSRWWIQFFESLPYNAGESAGLPMGFPDPLLLLFPGVTFFELKRIWQAPLYSLPITEELGVPIPAFLIEFSYTSYLFLLCVVVGIIALFKSRHQWLAIVYLLTLLIIPRGLLPAVIPTPIHYYRFVLHTWMLQIFVAVYGLHIVYNWIKALPRGRRIRHLRTIFYIWVGAGLLYSAVFRFSIEHDAYDWMRGDLPYKVLPQYYPDYPSAALIMNYLRQHPPKGRIAVESSYKSFERLSSPHFFTATIPRDLGFPVIPGLLAESAYSAEFLNSTIGIGSVSKIGSGHLLWGRTNLYYDERFKEQDLETMVDRLGLYHVDYIITTTIEYYLKLRELQDDRLVLARRAGHLALFRLIEPRPLLETTAYKPFLFIQRGGLDFRAFSKEWFKLPELHEYPVINTTRDYEDLTSFEKEQIGGLIISWDGMRKLTQKEYRRWTAIDKPIIFLNAGEQAGMPKTDRVRYVFVFVPWSGGKEFAYYLKTLSTPLGDRQEVVPTINENEWLRFSSSKPVLVNYTFSPRWEHANGERTVFMVTPSMMLVFGDGETELHFD